MEKLFQSVSEAIQGVLTDTNKKYDIEADRTSFTNGLYTYLAERITHSMYSKQPEIKVVGKDGELQEEATKKLLTLLEEQEFYTTLIAISKEVSMKGLGGLLIQTNSNNQTFIIPVSARHMFLPTFDQFGEMIELQLTRKLFAGAKPYFTQQHFTPNKTTTLFGTSASGNWTDYNTFNSKEKMFANSTLPKERKNRLNKIPVGLITNKVYKPNLIGDKPELQFDALSTQYNGEALIPRLMQVWNQIGREVHRSRTLLLSTDSSPDINSVQLSNKINTYNNDDMLNIIDADNVDYVGGNFQGVRELRLEFKEIFNDWLRQNFVSSNSNFAGKNNKNDIEIYQGSREEVQFIENRVALHQKALSKTLKLFIDELAINGDTTFNKEQKIVVNIITNEVRDSMQETQKYIQLYSTGLIPKEYAIKNSLSISETDAKIIVEQANQEEQARIKQEQALMPKGNYNDK